MTFIIRTLPGILLAIALALVGCGGKENTEQAGADTEVAEPVEQYPPTPVQGRNWRIPGIGVEFVHVAPGTFRMGTDDARPAEAPARTIAISRGFWIGRYELTQREAALIACYAPGTTTGPRLPAAGMSPRVARSWCRLLTERERAAGRLPVGYEYRPPTEAEWEYAASGGNGSPKYHFSGSDDQDEVAWHIGYGLQEPCEVGRLKPNALGIYDMSGNVSEMCLGRYREDWYAQCSSTDPVARGELECMPRGGEWDTRGDALWITTRRTCIEHDGGDRRIGLRLCLGPRVTPDGMAPTPEGGGMEPMFGLPDETEGDAGQPAAGNEWTVPGIGTVLLPVEAGSFEMGGKPVHTVRISRPYWIGKFEFTNEEYQALTGDDSVAEKYRALPRLYNWYDAALLCARLTGRERRAGRLPRGYEYRLPTEAEWEYAARGGSLSKGYEYSGSNDVSEVAWHGGNGPLESGPARNADGIRPVGGRKPNELGAHDMSGNVPEWCLDTYNDAFYAVSPEVDPLCVVGSRTLMGYGPNGYAPSLEDEAVARGAGIVLFQRALAYQEVTRPGSTRVGARCRMSRIRMLAGFRICLGPVVEHIDLK